MINGTKLIETPEYSAQITFPLIEGTQLFDATGVRVSQTQPYVRNNLLWVGISALEHETNLLNDPVTVAALGSIVTKDALKNPVWDTLQDVVYSTDPNEIAIAGLAIARMAMVVDAMHTIKTGQQLAVGTNFLDIYSLSQDPKMTLKEHNAIADHAGLSQIHAWRVHDMYRPKRLNTEFQCARSVIAIDREDESSVTWATTIEMQADGSVTLQGNKKRITGLDSTMDPRNGPISYKELLEVGNTLAATFPTRS